MLKWSVMKPVLGWQDDDNSVSVTTSPIDANIIQQLILDNNNSLVPSIIKIKTSSISSSSNPTSSYSSMSQSTSSDSLHHQNFVESIRNDDIWLILEKYYSSCVFATCLDLDSNSNCKKFAIPLDFDGKFF